MRRPNLSHVGLTVLALAAVAPGAALTSTDQTVGIDAVFTPEPDDICTNLIGHLAYDGGGLHFNDGRTKVRNMPLSWQLGEPVAGHLFLTDGGMPTFYADDGEVLRFDDSRFTEMDCTLD